MSDAGALDEDATIEDDAPGGIDSDDCRVGEENTLTCVLTRVVRHLGWQPSQTQGLDDRKAGVKGV